MPAGDDEVAHPGEPEERLGVGPGGLAEARHLREPARDQRRLRVVADLEPVAGAGGERDHVLRGRAELHPDQVVVQVDPEDVELSDSWSERAKSASSLAITAAPGRPAATSSAKFGPDITATGRPWTSVESRLARHGVEALRRG